MCFLPVVVIQKKIDVENGIPKDEEGRQIVDVHPGREKVFGEIRVPFVFGEKHNRIPNGVGNGAENKNRAEYQRQITQLIQRQSPHRKFYFRDARYPKIPPRELQKDEHRHPFEV